MRDFLQYIHMFEISNGSGSGQDEQYCDGIVGLIQNCMRKYGVADGHGRELFAVVVIKRLYLKNLSFKDIY